MHSTLVLHGATIRVREELKDSSTLAHESTVEKLKGRIESAIVATTLQNSKADEIEKIMKEREPLIEDRNAILDSHIKCLFPFYRKKLHEIDAKLDALDLQLFLLETEDSIKKSNLDQIISTAEAKLGKYSKYLNSK